MIRSLSFIIALGGLSAACGGLVSPEEGAATEDSAVVEPGEPDAAEQGSADASAPDPTGSDAQTADPDAEPPGPEDDVTGPDEPLCKVGDPCDDGDLCTDNDRCELDAQGVASCVGEPTPIDDDNPCTEDACTDGLVTHTPLEGAACDIESPCSEAGVCAEGVCQPETPCECLEDADCDQPESLCDGVAVCDTSGDTPACLIDPASVVTCEPSGDACQDNVCEPSTGECALSPLADGTACDDASVCTQADACLAGSCVGGAAIACDDGLFCNGAESCDAALGCQPGLVPEIDDGVACTVDSCDEEQDLVVNAPDASQCDDDNVCTEEVCDASEGCVSSPTDAPCSDEDPCTGDDQCVEGACQGTPILSEGPVCNNVDDDCDGATDEDCTFGIGGHVMGGGFVTATDPEGMTMDGSSGTRRFVGTITDGNYTLKSGLPPRGEDN